jgi:hypothetical protein
MLAIVVAYRKLSIRTLFIAIIDYADIATAEYRSFLRVIGYGELH